MDSLLSTAHLNDPLRRELELLAPHLRPIQQFSADDVLTRILDKIARGFIRSPKDIRRLRAIFSDHRSDDEIRAFLAHEWCSVDELRELVRLSHAPLTAQIRYLIRAVESRIRDGRGFTAGERKAIREFLAITGSDGSE